MHSRFFIPLAAILLLVFASSCKKHSEDLLFGVWEEVNVSNIEAPHSVEWSFSNGELSMYRRSRANTSDVVLTDQGFYLLSSNPFKTTLRLLETSQVLWNEHWDVEKLSNSQLIIKQNTKTGLLYKEFVRIQ